MGRVLHASKSGYFPFCIKKAEPNDVGEGTGFPLKMTLKKAMELYWRIREWNFYIDQDGIIADFNFQRRGDAEPDPNPTKEEELVCNIPIGGDFFRGSFDQIQPGIYFKYPSLEDPDLQTQIYFLKNETTNEIEYYPSIAFTGNYVTRTWSSVFTPPAEFTGTIEIETFGQFNCSLSGPFPQTIKMKPIKWWSYDGTYDENTGEPN